MVIVVISIMASIKIRFELVWCNIISSNPTPAQTQLNFADVDDALDDE